MHGRFEALRLSLPGPFGLPRESAAPRLGHNRRGWVIRARKEARKDEEAKKVLEALRNRKCPASDVSGVWADGAGVRVAGKSTRSMAGCKAHGS